MKQTQTPIYVALSLFFNSLPSSYVLAHVLVFQILLRVVWANDSNAELLFDVSTVVSILRGTVYKVELKSRGVKAY